MMKYRDKSGKWKRLDRWKEVEESGIEDVPFFESATAQVKLEGPKGCARLEVEYTYSNKGRSVK